MIREYTDKDLSQVLDIFERSGLPKVCKPNLNDPLFCVKLCAIRGKRVTQAGFVRIVGEGYLLVDHHAGDPEERWRTLQELTAAALQKASERGLSEVTAWVPPTVQKRLGGFGRRLEAMGFEKSRWPSWTALLE